MKKNRFFFPFTGEAPLKSFWCVATIIRYRINLIKIAQGHAIGVRRDSSVNSINPLIVHKKKSQRSIRKKLGIVRLSN